MSHVHKNSPGWNLWGGNPENNDPHQPPVESQAEPPVVENIPDAEDALIKLIAAFVAAGYSDQQAAAMARDTINHRPEIQKELDSESKQLTEEELEAPTQPATE